MAKLSANGFEVAGMVKSVETSQGEILDMQMSIRSNGWILVKSRIRDTMQGWSGWKRSGKVHPSKTTAMVLDWFSKQGWVKRGV